MKWDERFLDLARYVAQWSKDPSTQVGCVLVDDHRRVVGFPRGVDDNEDRYNDRSMKYLMVQHAEANAILNAVGKTAGCTAYVTHHPCANCAGLLIQSGVRRIVSLVPAGGIAERFADSFATASLMLGEAGVELKLD